MQKRKIVVPVDKWDMKTGSLDDGCARYALGRPTMRKVAEDAGAVVRIGRRYLVNFSKVDRYMDSIAE